MCVYRESRGEEEGSKGEDMTLLLHPLLFCHPPTFSPINLLVLPSLLRSSLSLFLPPFPIIHFSLSLLFHVFSRLLSSWYWCGVLWFCIPGVFYLNRLMAYSDFIEKERLSHCARATHCQSSWEWPTDHEIEEENPHRASYQSTQRTSFTLLIPGRATAVGDVAGDEVRQEVRIH